MVIKIMFTRLEIIKPQIPIFRKDKLNSKIIFIIDPINVPIMAVFAIFIACILVVRGP